MSEKPEYQENRRKLRALLSRAGYTATPVAKAVFEMAFGGKFRSWHIRVGLANGWLTFHVYFMDLPTIPSVRAALFERLAEINDDISVAKFVKSGDALTLDMEYREEHVDAEVMRNLVGMLLSHCEGRYLEVLRIVTGDRALQQLEEAFNKASLPTGRE